MIEIIPIISDSNCYLLKNDNNFILFDTGFKSKRNYIEKKLDKSGVTQENLKLIILSHGDVDHADNALFFKDKYNTKIAMNKLDEIMVTKGDMTYNRKKTPDKISPFFKLIIFLSNLSFKKEKFDCFTPDLCVEDGYSLTNFGFDATIIETPGHSAGSVSLLTKNGDLLCGDLFYNLVKPTCLMIDDMEKYNISLKKLEKLNINIVYPGHGKPFKYNRG